MTVLSVAEPRLSLLPLLLEALDISMAGHLGCVRGATTVNRA